MTISVTVTNSDTRETAVIKVEAIGPDDKVLSTVQVSKLKGQESATVYVHSHQRILITEVSQ